MGNKVPDYNTCKHVDTCKYGVNIIYTYYLCDYVSVMHKCRGKEYPIINGKCGTYERKKRRKNGKGND